MIDIEVVRNGSIGEGSRSEVHVSPLDGDLCEHALVILLFDEYQSRPGADDRRSNEVVSLFRHFVRRTAFDNARAGSTHEQHQSEDSGHSQRAGQSEK